MRTVDGHYYRCDGSILWARRRRLRSPSARSAFSMAEVVASVLVVSLMMAAAMQTVAASRVAQYRLADRSRGQMLADDLMTEILQKVYKDPGAAPVFGPETGELLRTQFNDVDDYSNWNESPPQNPDGTPMAGFTGWSRSVAVTWVGAADPTVTSSSETGAKRITVTVTRYGLVVARRIGVRTNVP